MMIESFLELLHYLTALVFGIFLSASFLGIRKSRKNALLLLAFATYVIALFFIFTKILCINDINKFYPIIAHIPFIFYLSVVFKKRISMCIMSFTTQYLYCQISKWIGLLALHFTNKMWIYYATRSIVTVVAFFILIQFVSDASARLLEKDTKSALFLSILPVAYYVFDYATEVYTSLFYSGEAIVAEFMGFMLSVVYILFIFIYFKEYEKSTEAKRKAEFLNIQYEETAKEIESIKQIEQHVKLLRHDMRHFMLTVSGYLESGKLDKAKEYLDEISQKIESAAIKKYTNNEFVNMIISSYEKQIADNNIDFSCVIQIPDTLSISEIDLTSIISNAFENAIKAVLKLSEDKRKISFEMRMCEDKLLIELKNKYSEMPVLVDGIPKTTKENHGLGTQSIRYITEKLGGNYQFSLKGEWFVLRVII